jgi:hypothetical protein
MKNSLSKLFTADNLLFGNVVVLCALGIWSLGWKMIFLPIAFLATFCVGGIAQWIVAKFINTKNQ